MAEANETLVSLKIEADMASLKKALQSINTMIKSALKAQIDLTFNVRGEKQIEAMKQRISKEIKIPVSFQNNAKTAPTPTPKTPVTQPVAEGGFQGFMGQMSDIQGQLSSVVGGAVLIGFTKGIANGIAQTGMQFENLKTTLSNALGGAAEGAAAMQIIRETANEVKLSIDEVGNGFNKLINRGLKPTKEEFIQLTDVAKSQGKEVDQYVEAVLDAMTGENERLKEFGVKAKDAGDKVIFTFKGVSTEVKKNEQDIYNYLVALGKVPGVAGMSAKAADTFSGKLANIQSKIDGIKIAIFERIGEALKPVLDVVANVLEGFQKWAEKNPELASGLTLIVMAITGLTGAFLVLVPIIAGVMALGAPFLLTIGAIALAIGALVFVLWDLWNGLMTGESYIFAIIDGFLEWIGVGITVQEIISAISEGFQMMVAFVVDYVVPVILESWQFLVDALMLLWDGFTDFISSIIDIIVGLFTNNIPLAAQGFVNLKNTVLNIFDSIVAAAATAVSRILSMFADAVNKIGDMVSGIPLIGGAIGGVVKAGGNAIKGLSDKAAGVANDRRSSVQTRKNEMSANSTKNNTGKKRFKMPGGNKNKGNKTDPYGKMKSGAGGGSSGGGKGKKGGKGGGGGKGKGKGKGNKGGGGSGSSKNKENIEEQKAIVSAIEGLQEVLKKTGYSIVNEIKRADLFEAKRKALLDSQRKEGAAELFKHIKEKFLGGNTKEVNNKVEIVLNGSKTSHGINENTRLKDIFKIHYSRSGG
nr:MAG TPA: tail tape measure [Caudoviricetes sp.]